MRIMSLALIGCIALCPGIAAAKDETVSAPIVQFADAFNKGDMAGAAATMADEVTIVDEFAPFQWHGRDAFARWGAEYEIDAKAKGITDPKVTIGAPTRELVSGDAAYVIVPARYTFQQKGVAMAEAAQMTFYLSKKGYDHYRISGWTWTGPNATPVK